MKVLVTNIHPKFPIVRMGHRFKKGETVTMDLRPRQVKALEKARYLTVEIVEEAQSATYKGYGWYQYGDKTVRKKNLPDGTIIEQ